MNRISIFQKHLYTKSGAYRIFWIDLVSYPFLMLDLPLLQLGRLLLCFSSHFHLAANFNSCRYPIWKEVLGMGYLDMYRNMYVLCTVCLIWKWWVWSSNDSNEISSRNLHTSGWYDIFSTKFPTTLISFALFTLLNSATCFRK